MFNERQPDSIKNDGVDSYVLTANQLRPLEEFDILDDSVEPSFEDANYSPAPWQVLIVDDDDEVHESTKFALKNVIILDRPIELLHAYSAAEGYELIQHERGISVALLDVVMESADAGLKLVEKIRANAFNELRIVLRTGQPGYAPEQSVLNDYDINDYRTKAELTRGRLISLLTTSFRCYRQLHIINESRRGLGLIVKSATDLFERKNLELFSQGVLTQLISLLDAPGDGVVCLMTGDESTTALEQELEVVTATGRFERFINKNLDEIEDVQLMSTLEKARSAEMGMHFDGALGLYFCSREGKKLYVYVASCSSLSDEHITLLKVFAGNIAIGFENLALIERLDELAYMDSMLGIPNRNAFELEFQRLQQADKPFAAVLVHINALSQSVSVFGVSAVNKALLVIRDSLAANLQPAPYCIAYDGKADLILLVDSDHIDIKGINALFDSRIMVDDTSLSLSATIAVVHVEDNMPAETALRYSTSALTIAKATPGTNVMYYNKSMTQGLTERLLLQSALTNALEKRDGIEAYLQPKVNCRDGSVIGAEALCRWTMGGRQISPADFIPIAEASGLASKLTEQMIEFVGDFARQRKTAGLPDLPVAINLSMYDLQTQNFADWLQEKLSGLGLSPTTVEFEITESVMMRDPVHAVEQLKELSESGYKIAIDDFGTGYSSLNYLEKLPVNCLKIDKTFIDMLDIHTAKESLVATAISIADHMGLTVVAEGIETKEQHDALLFLGCDVCQGYYFGRPLPIGEFNNHYQSKEAGNQKQSYH